MMILGIDPGIARTGWAVIQAQSSKLKAQNFGCIETSKDLPLEKRLSLLYEQLIMIMNEEKPDSLAIEDLFFNTNAKTAMVVGQARGVILLAATQKGLSVATYTPLQVKIAVTGYGRAEKRQVEKMMMVQLALKEAPKIDDTADALAIALAHAFSYKALQR